MKTIKKILLKITLILLTSINLWSNNITFSGLDLCKWMVNFLEKKGFNPEKINLISNTSNTFPYGLYINIKDENKNYSDNLIICVSMEEAFYNQNIISNLITDLKYRNFSSSIYFAYGSSKRIPRVRNINGIDNYLKAINTNKNNCACIIKLDKNENTIITNSMGFSSPAWMVNNAYDAFLYNDLGKDLPVYYLSQLSKIFYNNEEYFSSFSEQDIPAIGFSFNTKQTDHEIISNIITKFIDSYEITTNKENDYHALIVKIGDKKLFLSEYTIIKIVITVIIFSFLFFFILFFINSSLKSSAWKDIRKDWFTIPVTFFITIISFFIAKLINLNISKNSTDFTPYGITTFQLLLSSALISIYYWIEVSIRKKEYSERSIDFLILIVTFINQFILCIADISLFPLFLVICILSILSLILKKNWFHILLFTFMILMYIPFIIIIYKTSSSSLRLFFSINNVYIFIISLILLPIYLMLFRILTAIRNKITKKRIFALIISTSYFCFLFIVIILNYKVFNNKNNDLKFSNIQNITESNDDNLIINNTNKNIFGEQINTLTIETPKQAEVVIVKITGKSIIPVLYSDDEFTIDNTKSVSFKIPQYPPQKMTFNFCSLKTNFTIQVQAIYKNKNNDEYISYTKELNEKINQQKDENITQIF